MSVPHIQWWVAREPSPVHIALITEGLRRHRRYFKGAKLTVRTDSEEMPGTVEISGDSAWLIDPSQFLVLVEDCTE